MKFHTHLTEAKDIIFPQLVNLVEEAFGIPDKSPKVRVYICINTDVVKEAQQCYGGRGLATPRSGNY